MSASGDPGIRVSLTFPTHPKTQLLVGDLGPTAPMILIRLWTWTAANRPSGVLTDMEAAHVAVVVGWPPEDAEALVTLLVKRRWLDTDEHDGLAVHDWTEHQPYWAKQEERRERGKHAAAVRYGRVPNARKLRELIPLDQFPAGAARQLADAIRRTPIKAFREDVTVTPAWAENLCKTYPFTATPPVIGQIADWWLRNPGRTKSRRGCTRTVSNWLRKEEEKARARFGNRGAPEQLEDPSQGDWA